MTNYITNLFHSSGILGKIGLVLAIIIVAILIIALAAAVLDIIFDIESVLRSKYKKLEAETKLVEERRKHLEHLRTKELAQRVDSTEALLDLLGGIISSKIAALLFSYKTVGKEYAFVALADDIKSITEATYKSIKEDVWSSPSIMLDFDYIVTEINNMTSSLLITEVRKHNDGLRAHAIEVESEE